MIRIENLHLDFATRKGFAHVLKNVNIQIGEAEAVGIVGESGSGKSVSSLALMDLLPGNARITQGRIVRDRPVKCSMIFQDPMTSLNPCFTIEYQLSDVIRLHQGLSGAALREKCLYYLDLVGIPNPAERLRAFPFQMSGGQCQRIMIAMAMAAEPDLLIADEPTTALDVTIQAQILKLLRDLREKRKMSMLLISHDIGVIAQNTSRVYVMYAGEIVEEGPTKDVIACPYHPYTKALLNCLPSRHVRTGEDFRLPTIQGTVPDLHERPAGCAFRYRCESVDPVCAEEISHKVPREDRGYRCRL